MRMDLDILSIKKSAGMVHKSIFELFPKNELQNYAELRHKIKFDTEKKIRSGKIVVNEWM